MHAPEAKFSLDVALKAPITTCRLLCHLPVILKVIFANSVDPDGKGSTKQAHAITLFAVCKNRFEKSARIFSRRHKQTTFSDAVFLGTLRVKRRQSILHNFAKHKKLKQCHRIKAFWIYTTINRNINPNPPWNKLYVLFTDRVTCRLWAAPRTGAQANSRTWKADYKSNVTTVSSEIFHRSSTWCRYWAVGRCRRVSTVHWKIKSSDASYWKGITWKHVLCRHMAFTQRCIKIDPLTLLQHYINVMCLLGTPLPIGDIFRKETGFEHVNSYESPHIFSVYEIDKVKILFI